MKTKIKPYNNKLPTNFKNLDNDKNDIPKEEVTCICLSTIVIDSVFNLCEHYFPQVLLEEYEYKIRKRKTKSLIVDDLESSSNAGDSSDEEDIAYPPFDDDNYYPPFVDDGHEWANMRVSWFPAVYTTKISK